MTEIIRNTRTPSTCSTGTSKSIKVGHWQTPNSESESQFRVYNDIQEAIVKEMQSGSTRNAIGKEIDKLAETSVALEGEFAQIGWAIEAFSRNGLLTEDGQYPERWQTLHTEYTTLFLGSQKTAVQLKNGIDHLTRDLIPILEDPQTSLQAKKDEVTSFVDSLSESEKEGGQTELRFRRLSVDVVGFRQELASGVKFQYNQKHIEAIREIDDLKERIRRLEAELERLSQFVTRCWNVISGTFDSSGKIMSGIAATGVQCFAAFQGLIALAPAACITLLGVGIGVLAYNVGVAAQKNAEKLKDKKQEIKDFRKQLQLLENDLGINDENFKRQIADLDAIFDDVTSKLTSIQQIWRLLMADTAAIRVLLEDMGQDRTSPLMFERKLKRLRTMWEALYYALDRYILAVPRYDVRRDVSSQTQAQTA